ncbi:mechanosensitive ion channel family protein [Tunicatimonas pelagia]|uniref:mechanosensitive ion channel family protein n=1 Tax=Tunicatimonas pelagia TaxID=931531 RepID=UPI00266706AE|nr:mechanosensitive ion channel family protein [Tunicatimonas pelagia]WKN44359.1 mechanosensitive ion channel family protein [Tunicatimonas pelagia]
MNFNIENLWGLVTGTLEEWVKSFVSNLPNLVLAVLIVVLFILLAKVVKSTMAKILGRVSANEAVNNLLVTLVNVAIIVAGIFIALGVLGQKDTVATLLAGVGIIGLALGFAFQDIAANFISGILIAVRQPFKIGDTIESADYFGKVSDINLRTTTITTFQGLDVLIPNKNIFENPVVNYTRTKDRRVDLSVGVSYGDDLEKVKKLTIDTLSELDSIDRSKDVTLFYNEFGGSSINFTVRFWAKSPKQPDFLQAQSDAIIAIQQVYDRNDIVIPFPIRTLDFGIKGGEKLSEMTIHHGNGQSAN